MGKPWVQLEPRLQAIILGMLRVAAGGLMGYGCTLFWLLLPLQRGEAWAAWAARTISLVVTAPVLYVVVWLRRVSPAAKTPVIPTLAVMALALAGTRAFFAGRA